MKKLPVITAAVALLALAACETDPSTEPTYECDLTAASVQDQFPPAQDYTGDGWIVICVPAALVAAPMQEPAPASTVYGP